MTPPLRGFCTSWVAVTKGMPSARSRSMTAQHASVTMPRCQNSVRSP